MGRLGTLFLVILLVGGSIGISYGVWRQSAPRAGHQMMVGSLAHLPVYVQNADAEVQAAYQFATEKLFRGNFRAGLLGALPYPFSSLVVPRPMDTRWRLFCQSAKITQSKAKKNL